MSWTPTDEQWAPVVEKTAREFVYHTTNGLVTEIDDQDRAVARAVLVAVGPMIADDAWDEAAEVAAKHGSRWFSNPYKRQEAGR